MFVNINTGTKFDYKQNYKELKHFKVLVKNYGDKFY